MGLIPRDNGHFRKRNNRVGSLGLVDKNGNLTNQRNFINPNSHQDELQLCRRKGNNNWLDHYKKTAWHNPITTFFYNVIMDRKTRFSFFLLLWNTEYYRRNISEKSLRHFGSTHFLFDIQWSKLVYVHSVAFKSHFYKV